MECILETPEAIEEYHHVASRIRDIDMEQIKLLVARYSATLLVTGRVVVLLKGDQPAVIVQQQRPAPGATDGSTLMKGKLK